MKGYEAWIDKGNPHTELEELSGDELTQVEFDLRSEIENLIDEYVKIGLEPDDIAYILREFC